MKRYLGLCGLLLAAPLAKSPVTIEVTGPLVSRPYIELTLGVMQRFGIEVQRLSATQFQVAPQAYQACNFAIEPDASSASYFFAAAAICGDRNASTASRNSRAHASRSTFDTVFPLTIPFQ